MLKKYNIKIKYVIKYFINCTSAKCDKNKIL